MYSFVVAIKDLLWFEVYLYLPIIELHIFCDTKHIMFEFIDCFVIAV